MARFRIYSGTLVTVGGGGGVKKSLEFGIWRFTDKKLIKFNLLLSGRLSQ